MDIKCINVQRTGNKVVIVLMSFILKLATLIFQAPSFSDLQICLKGIQVQ